MPEKMAEKAEFAVSGKNGSSQYFTILEQFQAFYLEIIELKTSARTPALLPAGTVEMIPAGGRPEEIWRQAAAILDRQSQEMVHAGPIEAMLQREARFVMAAQADEVFVHPRWEGTEYWLSHLLETRLFHTHSAGDVFFQKLSLLMSRNDPSTDQLAVIYLMTLALGFRGKYAGTPDGEAILRGLRVRLFELIQLRNPRLLDANAHLFPDAYGSTVHEGLARRLPAPGKWLLGAGAVVLFWLLVSTGLWQVLSGDLSLELQEGLAKASTSAAASAEPAAATGTRREKK
jgi:type VI secretion system protein ImpK